MKALNDLFLAQLADMYDAEQRIARALPELAQASTCDRLRAALQTHLEETRGHVAKLEEVFASISKTAERHECRATVGLLKEADDLVSEFEGSPAINAALIAACQKVEHYEMATYGCLREWAGLLGYREAVRLLDSILDQEKTADAMLTELARTGKNEEAGEESDAEESRTPPSARGRGTVVSARSSKRQRF